MPSKRLDWTNTIVVFVFHLLAVAAVGYLVFVEASLWTIGLGLLWLTLCGLSITAGYHRMFAHPTYQGHAIVRTVWLLFGAASVQNSALKWASDHRFHHARTDQDDDPYSVRRGFWWAHIGWVLFEGSEIDPRVVADLERDPLVRLQHRYYTPLAILMSAIVPAAIGTAWGDPIGAVLVAGFLRLVIQWHGTFSINSVAHTFGRQPFCKRGTARDSFVAALLTFGEGYHNFHHRFKSDYRNGVRWYHFDPTKWLVWSLSKVGLARNLRRVTREVIEQARRETRAAGA